MEEAKGSDGGNGGQNEVGIEDESAFSGVSLVVVCCCSFKVELWDWIESIEILIFLIDKSFECLLLFEEVDVLQGRSIELEEDDVS